MDCQGRAESAGMDERTGSRPRIGITMGSAGISEYERAVEQAGGEPHRLSADVDRVLRDIGEYDGFVISGGDDVAPSRYGAPLEPETQTAPAERDEYEIALVRAAFERRLARTAISAASATAVAPSYSDALETCMPVRLAIIDWYS